MGDHGRILLDIKNMFGPMTAAPPDTFWEIFDPGDVYSLCHGIGSAVGAFIVRDYLGIRAGEKGFRGAVVEPHPAGMRWAKGSINTESVRISASWVNEPDRFEIQVKPVSGGTVTVKLSRDITDKVRSGKSPQEIKVNNPARLVFGPAFEEHYAE